ncbi:hypothetical protein [Streptococcus tangpeifui]|uniref:hypothetical protein n=1 Tax=Streptococcus tangpeifui TaxID=2709400 RepID=UPI0013EA1FEB|nr:hypothetical protein [Streptococcus sp. ZJ373]
MNITTLDTVAFDDFEIADADFMASFSGGGNTVGVLTAAATSLGFGAAACLAAGTPVGWLYLGAQGLAMAAEYAYSQE